MTERALLLGHSFLVKDQCLGQEKKELHLSIIVEAKYVAVAVNYSNIVWFKQLLIGMKEKKIKDPIVIFYDNTSVINISNNPMMHTKTKHIAIKYHFMRELVQDKEVRLEYVNRKEQVVDIFTKPLPKDAFFI